MNRAATPALLAPALLACLVANAAGAAEPPATVTAAEKDPRVAVIAVGQDALLGGTLQQRIEDALLRESRLGANFVLVPSSAIATRTGAPLPIKPPASENARIAALLAQAFDAYVEDKLIDAMEKVTDASRLIDAGLGGAGTDRVIVLTWRTALFLAMKNEAQAKEEARRLLTLAPEASPDPNVFRPSVERFVSGIRKTMAPPVEVKLEGAPPGARIEVDGRRVEARFRIGPGEHQVRVLADGFRPVSVGFDAKSDLVVGVTPMLDLTQAQLTLVNEAIGQGGKARVLEALTRQLGVDALLVLSVSPQGSLRASLGRLNGDLRRSGKALSGLTGVAEIARWTATEVASIKPEPRAAPGTPEALAEEYRLKRALFLSVLQDAKLHPLDLPETYSSFRRAEDLYRQKSFDAALRYVEVVLLDAQSVKIDEAFARQKYLRNQMRLKASRTKLPAGEPDKAAKLLASAETAFLHNRFRQATAILYELEQMLDRVNAESMP